MALGDRYFAFTKAVNRNLVVLTPPPPMPKILSVDEQTQAFEAQRYSESGIQDKTEFVKQYQDDFKVAMDAHNNFSRGPLSYIGSFFKAIIKPFALLGAAVSDLVANVYRIPADIGSGIAGLFRAKPQQDDDGIAMDQIPEYGFQDQVPSMEDYTRVAEETPGYQNLGPAQPLELDVKAAVFEVPPPLPSTPIPDEPPSLFRSGYVAPRDIEAARKQQVHQEHPPAVTPQHQAQQQATHSKPPSSEAEQLAASLLDQNAAENEKRRQSIDVEEELKPPKKK